MGKKISRRRNSGKIEFLENALLKNGHANRDGPARKKWTTHDLANVKPLTPTQEEMFHSFFNNQHICAYGSAGTGKTFLALYLALTAVLRRPQEQSKIIIVRSVVPTREVGHLPGTLEEKTIPYEIPYRDILHELVGRHSTYDDMKSAGLIEFMTTSFIRGLTWEDAIVIVDEGQNMSFHEINSIMTRLGENSRVIFTGDLNQSDLTRKYDASGMNRFLRVTKNMNEFDQIRFTLHDIVRSAFVKAWITATETIAV